MMKQTRCYGCDKREALTVTMPMEEFDKLEKLALSAHTDSLSVEKLQEQIDTAKKALTEIYLDENETIIDPVFLFHQSQRIAGRALNELGENNEI